MVRNGVFRDIQHFYVLKGIRLVKNDIFKMSKTRFAPTLLKQLFAMIVPFIKNGCGGIGNYKLIIFVNSLFIRMLFIYESDLGLRRQCMATFW